MLRRFGSTLNLLRVGSARTTHQLIPVRCIRTRNSEEPNEQAHKNDEKPESDKRESPIIRSKVVVVNFKKLMVISLVSLGITTLLTYYMISRGGVTDITADSIAFDEFIEKFLKMGEVKSIVYFPGKRVGIATLHEGAIIDGKPYKKLGVVFRFDKAFNGQYDELNAEIRRIEDKLKIDPRDGIPVTRGPEFSTFRMIEFMIGASIIMFLIIGYARLGARRLLAKQAANKTNGSSSQKPK